MRILFWMDVCDGGAVVRYSVVWYNIFYSSRGEILAIFLSFAMEVLLGMTYFGDPLFYSKNHEKHKEFFFNFKILSPSLKKNIRKIRNPQMGQKK